MLPTQGQGASQAIEDAEALGAFFQGVVEPPSTESLSGILEVGNVSSSRSRAVKKLTMTGCIPNSIRTSELDSEL